MRRVRGCDAINHALWIRWPVGGRECESIIRARIQRLHLHRHAVDPTAADAELQIITDKLGGHSTELQISSHSTALDKSFLIASWRDQVLNPPETSPFQ